MERKIFKSIDEATAWLEYELFKVHRLELMQQQLDYLDQAVLQSDMKESKQVIEHIMRM